MIRYILILLLSVLTLISCNNKPEVKKSNSIYSNPNFPGMPTEIEENLPVIKLKTNSPIKIDKPTLIEFTVNDCFVGILGISSSKFEIQTLFPSMAYRFKMNNRVYYLNYFLFRMKSKNLKIRIIPGNSPVNLEISTDKNYTQINCDSFALTPFVDLNTHFMFITAPQYNITILSPDGRVTAREKNCAGIFPVFHNKRYTIKFEPQKNCNNHQKKYFSILRFHIGKQN